MYVIRDVFRCKPRKSKAVADKFKSAIPLMNKLGLTRNPRVLLDFVASYWTVVLESEADSLEQFEREMETYMSKRSCGKRWPDTTT
jgi:hypothetical protein